MYVVITFQVFVSQLCCSTKCVHTHQVHFLCISAPAVPVSNVTITRINDTAVRVTWMRLTLNDARGFPSYVVSVTSKGKEAVNHSTNSTSVVVEGLLPHTEYNVTVRALTAGGTKGGPRSTPGERGALHTCIHTPYRKTGIYTVQVNKGNIV